MRKSVLAVVAGLMLVAGQAAAANNATVRVGDRVGAKSDTANEFVDVPVAVILMAAVAVTGAVVVANEDDSPASA